MASSLFGGTAANNQPPTSLPPLMAMPGPPTGAYGVHDVTLGGAVNRNANGDEVNFAGAVLKNIPGTPQYQQSRSGGASTSTGSGGGGGVGPGTITSTAAHDPNLDAFLQSYRDRMSQLQAGVNAPNTEDVGREINQSDSGISDNAEGQKNAAAVDAARRGVGAEGAAQANTQIGENAQRLQAGAAANITIEGQRRQDEAVQHRQDALNAMYAGYGQASAMPGERALQQQGLGLEQMRIEQQAQETQAAREAANAQRQQALWLSLAGLGGGY